MRIALLSLFALSAVACSDSTNPNQPFQPAAGTYEMILTSCIPCTDPSEPDLAVLWMNGVFARVDVSSVSGTGAQGEYLALETLSGSNLLDVLESHSFEISRLTNGDYRGSIGFGDGTISVALVPNGCAFALSYPNVVTGAGACQIQ